MLYASTLTKNSAIRQSGVGSKISKREKLRYTRYFALRKAIPTVVPNGHHLRGVEFHYSHHPSFA